MSYVIITGDINFDNVVDVMYGRFIYCKVTVFAFCIDKYLRGRNSDTTRISYNVSLLQLCIISAYNLPLIIITVLF